MAFCGKCGQQLPDTARFCGKCGTAMVPEPVAQGVASGAAAQPTSQGYSPQPPSGATYPPGGYVYPPRPSFASRLSASLWVVLIGAAVSALFTIITWIKIASAASQMSSMMGGDSSMPTPMAGIGGAMHLAFLLLAVLFVAVGLLALSAGGRSGTERTIRSGLMLGLSGFWPVATLYGLILTVSAGVPLGMMGFDMSMLIVLGGIVQGLGALVDLVQNA